MSDYNTAYVVIVDNYHGGLVAMPMSSLCMSTQRGLEGGRHWYYKAAALITKGGYAEADRLARAFNALEVRAAVGNERYSHGAIKLI